jgi:hypothetical protein
MRKAAILFLCIFAAGAVLAEDAPAPRSKAEIAARWEGARPTYMDWRNMEVYGDLNPPIAIGKPKADYIDDGLKMVNFLRYLAGLPDDVRIDEGLNYKAQILTAINAMNDYNSHDPEKPAAMPKELYDLGFAVGHQCNLEYSIMEGTTHPNAIENEVRTWGPFPALAMDRRFYLARMSLDCFGDADIRNVAKVGHRRNMMRPEIAKVGFGYVDVYEEVLLDADEIADAYPGMDFSAGTTPSRHYLRQYSASYVLDRSRKTFPDFDYLAWPSRGYFPLQFWNYGSYYPWSVSLNPDKYGDPHPAALKVEIADAKGSFKITLDKNSRLGSYGMLGDFDFDEKGLKPFLYYLPQTPSWLPMVHFYPGEGRLPKAVAGDRYRVTIQGLKDRQGKAAPLAYWVEFFELPNASWILEPSLDM